MSSRPFGFSVTHYPQALGAFQGELTPWVTGFYVQQEIDAKFFTPNVRLQCRVGGLLDGQEYVDLPSPI